MKQMQHTIFLIGMPSSGKSTLGRKLAKLLEYRFQDMDEQIERQEGLTVSEIFNRKGEDFFRKIEATYLRSIPANAGWVVATGGGTPCFYEGINYIKENGVSIYLDVLPQQLCERMLTTTKNDRPLLSKESPEVLLKNLEKLYQHRLPLYSQADFQVMGDTSAETLANLVQEWFRYMNI